MTNVIDIKSKTKKQGRPTIVASAEENHLAIALAFGVDSTFVKVENLDDDSVEPVYAADFKVSGINGVLASAEAIDSALYVWRECYKDRFFDSPLSVMIQFIECVAEAVSAETGFEDRPTH